MGVCLKQALTLIYGTLRGKTPCGRHRSIERSLMKEKSKKREEGEREKRLIQQSLCNVLKSTLLGADCSPGSVNIAAAAAMPLLQQRS